MPSRNLARTLPIVMTSCAFAFVLGACGAGRYVPPTTSDAAGSPPAAHRVLVSATPPTTTTQSTPTTTTQSTPTTTTQPPPTTTTQPPPATSALPPLGAPGPGIVPGHVTAIGDSVMIDEEVALQQDIPGIDVEATVSFQWSQGVALAQQLKAEGRLGQIVVIGLGTNGPISAADFEAMMAACAGVSRIVFITVHVDQPWQDEVNATLAAGVARYRSIAVLADWYALSAPHPEWFYSDGTHLPIDGPGAQALAALVASKVKG